MMFSTIKILKKKEFIDRKLKNDQISFLKENGYLLIPPSKKIFEWIGMGLTDLLAIIDSLVKKEGLAGGSEGKEEFSIEKGKKIEEGAYRLSNLIDKHFVMRKVATIPEILWGAYEVLDDDIKLSSIIFREPIKNQGQQDIHIDWLPRENSTEKFGEITAMLYLDDSKTSNGATRIIPKSHKKNSYPEKYINPKSNPKEEIVIEAKAGSILILNSNTWHRGGENITGERRRILNIDYRRRELKQLLNSKMYISKFTQSTLSDEETYFFGLRDEDTYQNEKSYGPGSHRREWLKQNPQYNYKN